MYEGYGILKEPIKLKNEDTYVVCREECRKYAFCVAWILKGNLCYIKHKRGVAKEAVGLTSGLRCEDEPPGMV